MKVFDGECADDGIKSSEIKIFAGDDNPGKTYEERVAECAKGCLSKTWNSGGTHVAKGFIVRLNGRCFCESSSALTCKRIPVPTVNYTRYEWSSSGH